MIKIYLYMEIKQSEALTKAISPVCVRTCLRAYTHKQAYTHRQARTGRDEPDNGHKKISDLLEPIEDVDLNSRGPRMHKIPKPGEKVECCPKCGSREFGVDRVWIGGRGYKQGIFCHNPRCKELTVLW